MKEFSESFVTENVVTEFEFLKYKHLLYFQSQNTNSRQIPKLGQERFVSHSRQLSIQDYLHSSLNNMFLLFTAS